ncbi:MAG: DUF2066 domain-containing protein [Alphaproteobacteria bacterium]
MLRHSGVRRPGASPNLLLAALLMLSAVACLVLLAPQRALAASETYTVRDVPVEAKAESAASAREVAFAKGQRDAFEHLISRLVLSQDRSQVPSLSDGEITELIEGFEVNDEKVSPTTYRASLTVSFQESQINALLRRSGVGFAENRAKPVVIVPVTILEDGPALWQEDNLWLYAWTARDVPGGLVPVIVPLGDAADISSLNAAQAVSGDAAALGSFAARYGAAEAVVAEAKITPPKGENGAALVELNVERVGAGKPESYVERVRGAAGQPLEEVLALATDRVVTRLNESWKVANVIRYDSESELRVVVPLAGLSNWVEVRRTLSELSQVSEVEVVALARSGADIVLHFYGAQGQLEAALHERDLLLTPRPDGGYMLAPRSSPAGTTVGAL